MRNKLLSCLRYNLKKLLASPVTWLVVVLTILFVTARYCPCATSCAIQARW